MTDPRTERMAGYIRHEHANSYTVDTGGIKELVAKITGNNKNKYGRSTEHKVVDLQILSAQLAERVTNLENRMLHNEDQLVYLQDRARQDAMKSADLSKNVREITQLLVGIQAWQKQTQKVLLKIIDPRAVN